MKLNLCVNWLVGPIVLLTLCNTLCAQLAPLPTGHGGVLVVLGGRDTSTKAEGNRLGTDFLVMVAEPIMRSAEIIVDPQRSENLARLRPGYPKWSGAGVVGKDGELTARWHGTLPGAAVKCEYEPGKIATFDINTEPNQGIQFNIDSETFDNYIEAANKLVNAISEVKDPFKINGSLEGSVAVCDMYNDGESLGKRVTLGGEVSLDCNLLDLKKVVPTSLPGVSVRVGAKLDALKIVVSGDFVFDEGMQYPWLASSGSISGGGTVSVLGEGILGLATDEGDVGIIIGVTGSTSIKATGTITGEERSIYAQGSGEAGKLVVEGTLSARFGPLGEWRLGSVDFVIFEGETGKSEKQLLYSF